MGGKTGASRFGHGVKESTGPIPTFPLATGNLVKPGTPLQHISERLKARPSQIAIAWLLRKSPVMLPIPGTSKVKHLEENASAALIKLDDALMEELDRLPNRNFSRGVKKRGAKGRSGRCWTGNGHTPEELS